jgi:hypothetical protein
MLQKNRKDRITRLRVQNLSLGLPITIQECSLQYVTSIPGVLLAVIDTYT